MLCERWKSNFANFVEDMGERPSKKHSVERIDVNGNYEPLNCKWATHKEQMRNMRSNVVLTIDGVSRSLAEWTEITGVNYGTAKWRLSVGIAPEKAIQK